MDLEKFQEEEWLERVVGKSRARRRRLELKEKTWVAGLLGPHPGRPASQNRLREISLVIWVGRAAALISKSLISMGPPISPRNDSRGVEQNSSSGGQLPLSYGI